MGISLEVDMGLVFWLSWLILIALGLLGASSVIVKKKPEAKELLDKLAKFSGWVGVLAVIWGVVALLQLLSYIRYVPMLSVILSIASIAVFLGLGFIFGYGLIATYLSEQAKSKAEDLRRKLVGYQVILGWTALVLAALQIVLRVF